MAGDDDRFDLSRALGRVEQKIDNLREMGATRDLALEALTERVRTNNHNANNVAQRLTNQVDLLQSSGKRIESKVDGLDGRVRNLEAPVKRAMMARQARRRLWVKVTTVAAAVGGVTWFFLEPVYRLFAEGIVKRWFGTG